MITYLPLLQPFPRPTHSNAAFCHHLITKTILVKVDDLHLATFSISAVLVYTTSSIMYTVSPSLLLHFLHLYSIKFIISRFLLSSEPLPHLPRLVFLDDAPGLLVCPSLQLMETHSLGEGYGSHAKSHDP